MAQTPVDHAFLERLRAATESAWRDYVPRDFQAAGVGGLDWQTGTRWRGGMTDAEIEAAEDRYGLTFAPDYRLFLATLHTPDPSMVGARFEGSHLVPKEGRSFPDWTGDPAAIETFIAWPLEGSSGSARVRPATFRRRIATPSIGCSSPRPSSSSSRS